MTVHGAVAPGTGRASRLHIPERLAVRSDAAGVGLVPGTLNVRVDDVASALAEFGGPRRTTEPWCRIGPGLNVYPATIRSTSGSVPAVITRSENSRSSRTLEVMAGVSLRATLDLRDGDPVILEPRPW